MKSQLFKTFRRIAIKTLTRAALPIAAFGFTLEMSGCGSVTLPSDAAIIARFSARRAEFSELLAMFSHDAIVGRLGCADSDDGTSSPQPISQDRRAEYGKLFKMIGCDGAVYYWPDSQNPTATFTMSSVGMLSAGKDKSIVWFPGEPPSPIVDTTDGYKWTPADRQRGAIKIYRHIEGPWYLSYGAN